MSKLIQCLFLILIMAPLQWAHANNLLEQASAYNDAGKVALGFKELAKNPVSADRVSEKFAKHGQAIETIAQQWAQDEKLRNSKPPYRRYLFYDYITKGSDIMAVATNPKGLVINPNAGVEKVFQGHDKIIEFVNANMVQTLNEPTSKTIDNYFVVVFPMVINNEQSRKCASCHASEKINKPYPENSQVFGYTVVAIPK